MNKQQALYKFWGSFGLPVYEQNNVPYDVIMPYITYAESIGSIGDNLTLTGSLWYFSEDEERTDIVDKTNEIAEAIGLGGMTVKYDDGMLWVKKGTPFAQAMDDPQDTRIKRMVLNLSAEYLSR